MRAHERFNGGPFASAARYYHSNFFPRTMCRGQSPAAVAGDATDPEERAAYAANAGRVQSRYLIEKWQEKLAEKAAPGQDQRIDGGLTIPFARDGDTKRHDPFFSTCAVGPLVGSTRPRARGSSLVPPD